MNLYNISLPLEKIARNENIENENFLNAKKDQKFECKKSPMFESKLDYVEVTAEEFSETDSQMEFEKDLFYKGKQPETPNYNILGFKRLRKKADKNKEKILKKIAAKELFELEAELGSDNEENDDKIKPLLESDLENESYLENKLENLNTSIECDFDENHNLKNLIDDKNTLNNSEAEKEIKLKFFNEMLLKDKDEIKKVIEGPSRNKKLNYYEINLIEEDSLPLYERIRNFKGENSKKIISNENFVESLFRAKIKISKKLSDGKLLTDRSLEKETTDNTIILADDKDEEMKEILQNHEIKLIKRISQKITFVDYLLKNRKKINKRILEDVVDLTENDGECYNQKDLEKNTFFVKGNILSNKTFKHKINQREINSKMQNNYNKFGLIYNFKNSVLHAIKTNKYYLIEDKRVLPNGDWGLGIGDWGLGPIPNPPSPIPNPQNSFIFN